MLRPALMKRYQQLFDEAEASVSNDPVLLERVKRARLPLLYSELELLRTEQEKDFTAVVQKLDYFEKEIERMGDPALNERNNHAMDYCKLYRERYLPRKKSIWLKVPK